MTDNPWPGYTPAGVIREEPSCECRICTTSYHREWLPQWQPNQPAGTPRLAWLEGTE